MSFPRGVDSTFLATALMWEFLQSDQAQFTLWFAIGVVLVAVGFYIIRRFPRGEEGDKVGTSDMMSTFRELHSRGELSDEEYRNIKTKLAARLKEELSTDDEEADFTES